MTTLASLTNKLFGAPTTLQFLIAADCLQELGFVERAWAMRLGFYPDVSTAWYGSSGYGDGGGGGSNSGFGSGGDSYFSGNDSFGYGSGDGGYHRIGYGDGNSSQVIFL